MAITSEQLDMIVRRQQQLWAERSNFNTQYQELVDYVLPSREGVTTITTPGTKRNLKRFDATATNAVRNGAAGLVGGFTPPNSPWFNLQAKNRDLMDYDPVKLWFEHVEKRILDGLNSSNFNGQIHEAFIDLFVFGTFNLYVEEDPARIFRFSERHIAEYVVSEGMDGNTDTVFRKFDWSARQCVQQWKDQVSDKIARAAEKEPDRKIKIVHAVLPREDRDSRKRDNLSLPWQSVYFEEAERHVLEETGYEEFPFIVCPWSKNTGEKYGYSPAMDVLPSIKVVNKITEDLLRAASKMIDPPIMVPDDGFVTSPLRLSPGSIIRYRAGSRGETIQPFDINGKLPIGIEMREQERAVIKQAFFEDLFLSFVNHPQMTATEVLKRYEEKIMMLGPTLGRIQRALSDLIVRCFGMMMRGGYLHPPPEELDGHEYEIDFISPLAKAQRIAQAQSLTKTLEIAGPLLQFSPEVMDNWDPDKIFRGVSDLVGLPAEWMRQQNQVEEIRAAKAEAAQQQAMIDMAERGVGGLKTLSEVDKNSAEVEQKGGSGLLGEAAQAALGAA